MKIRTLFLAVSFSFFAVVSGFCQGGPCGGGHAVSSAGQSDRDVPTTGRKLKLTPVIEFASDKAATIAWPSNLPPNLQMVYGTRPAALKAAHPIVIGQDHRATLDNLSPRTTYYIGLVPKQVDAASRIMSLSRFQTAGVGEKPIQSVPAVAVDRGAAKPLSF